MPVHARMPSPTLILLAAVAFVALVALAGCRHTSPEEDVDRYEGPVFHGSIVVVDSDPPRWKVHVTTTAPTGGYDLVHDSTEQNGAHTDVRLTLVEPGPDELVTMALEPHEVLLDLGDTRGPVRVHVARTLRGVHYVTAPPHRIALVLAR